MLGFPENRRLTNRDSGNGRICNICSILVVSLAMHECVLANASAPDMPPGRVRIIRYLRYLSSGTLKNIRSFQNSGNPGLRISGFPDIPFSEFPEIRKFDAAYVLASRH